MTTNESHLEKLQRLEREQRQGELSAAREQGRMTLHTLKAKHRFNLERLPRLQAELDVLLASDEAIDYATLVAAFDTTVQQASDFLMAVDLAPVDYPDQPDLPALGHSLAALMSTTTVAALAAKFQQRCTAGMGAAKAREADEAKLETLRNMGYVVKDDGTVTDTKTQLMWKQCAEGQTGPDCKGSPQEYNWDIAMKIPETLNQRGGFAGHNDWRLPTKDELSSLEMHGRKNPAICTEAFPNAPSNAFWSSSPYDDSGAWFVYFNDGSVYDSRNNSYAVRLVRASQ